MAFCYAVRCREHRTCTKIQFCASLFCFCLLFCFMLRLLVCPFIGLRLFSAVFCFLFLFELCLPFCFCFLFCFARCLLICLFIRFLLFNIVFPFQFRFGLCLQLKHPSGRIAPLLLPIINSVLHGTVLLPLALLHTFAAVGARGAVELPHACGGLRVCGNPPLSA